MIRDPRQELGPFLHVPVLQVTRDGVPVIWHDDHVLLRSPSGQLSARTIAELDVAEFKAVQPQQIERQRCDGNGSEPELAAWRCDAEQELPMCAHPAGPHLPDPCPGRIPAPSERRAETGLARRLNEVFRHVPESVGFDIEVKMTTPDSAPATPPAEVARVVGAILAEVREWEAVSYRRLAFSTFDPDVALELKRRQASIPASSPIRAHSCIDTSAPLQICAMIAALPKACLRHPDLLPTPEQRGGREAAPSREQRVCGSRGRGCSGAAGDTRSASLAQGWAAHLPGMQQCGSASASGSSRVPERSAAAAAQVLFLSDGETHHADARRNGLDVAVDWAARHGLDGVVLESAALAAQPGVVAAARQRGLHVLTYGTRNDEPAFVRQQQGWGVGAAIVDDVSRVVAGLA